jgi:predicted ATPase
LKPAPFLSHVRRDQNVPLDPATFPGNLRFVADLDLTFETPVTFFVGENGSGKSTLLEAIAVLSGFPQAGGGTNDLASSHGLNEKSVLADGLRAGFASRPRDGYFFRADLQAHFASLLDARRNDPEFRDNHGGPADPYRNYGGRPLHALSHGEAFLATLKNRVGDGLYILDEPESALSPQRQLALLAMMYDAVHRAPEEESHGKKKGARGRGDCGTQFVIATHSAILLTYPGARIISFDNERLEAVTIEETTHYQITHGVLTRPESYWKHLRGSP